MRKLILFSRYKIYGTLEYFIYLFYSFKYKKPAHPKKVIYINIEKIEWMLIGSKHVKHRKDYNRIKKINGLIIDSDLFDYKVSSEKIIGEHSKLRGIEEHFVQNIPWIQTILFTEYYKRRFKKTSVIKGSKNLNELAEYYNNYYDSIFESIKSNGVKSPEHDRSIDPILVDIYKDGSFCYTVGGNHRLMMIRILEIKKIPVRIRSRHIEWQLLRDELYNIGENAFFKKHPQLREHPDLIDCL